MPGNITAPTPTDVLPFVLCAAFTEELRLEGFVNRYQDGNSDRFALALNPRHFFRFTGKLKASQYTSLFSFYKAHLIAPFYFYNVFETPNFSWDGTGSSTVGRYTVVFDGTWSDMTTLGRSQASLGLREVG